MANRTLAPWICIFILCWTVTGIANQEETLTAPTLAPPAESSSIYKINPWTDGAIILGTNLFTLSAYAFQYSLINRRCPCDPNEVNSFDRPAIYNTSSWAGIAGNFGVGIALSAPLVVDYLDVGWSRNFRDDMTIYLETMSVNWFLVNMTKFATQRPLPRLYAAQTQGDPSDYLAFYSGHTCTTVSAMASLAMTYNLRHGFHWWPWIAAGALGAFVGYDMVASAGHYPSDVIVGFIMGGAVGYVVPLLHSKENGQGISFAPVDGGMMAFWNRAL